MANPQASVDAAALIAATDREGRVNPMAYEAQRLVLHHQRMGGIDADALVNDLQRSPGFEQFNRGAFYGAIEARLDTPAEKERFAKALDAANLTDGLIERKGEQLAEVVGDAYGYVTDKVGWANEFLTRKMSWAYQRAGELQSDPNATPEQRLSAELARNVVGKAQELYGEGSGGVVHSLNTLKGFVDVGVMGYRFTTNENYRDLLISTAKLYAAETMDDPSKPVRDLRNAATQALENWEKEYAQAKAEGRERQFLGATEGAIGVEIAATLVPVSKLAKFGKVASSLERTGAEGMEEAVELAGDANRALRRTEDAPIPHPGESLGEAAVRSARAAGAAQDVLRAEIRFFRDEGKLDQLIEAAHKTDNVEGLLRSGELAPRELMEMAKRDPSMFTGKVDFAEAIDLSTKGARLTGLTTKQLGDIGEALHTYDLVKAGHTDIVSIKNASGHGIDVVSRNRAGDLEFHEVKTSAQGLAKGPQGDPAEFVASRLRRAIDQRGHWAEHNTMPGLDEAARKLRGELVDENGQIVQVNAKWIQINLSQTPGEARLRIDKTEKDWVAPEPKKQSTLDSLNPADQLTHQRIMGQAGANGIDDVRGNNLALQGLLALKQSALVKDPDDVGIYGSRLFIASFPHGRDREPNFHVSVDVAMASQQPAQETLKQIVQVDQQRVQDQLSMSQQQSQNQAGPSGPVIGARTA